VRQSSQAHDRKSRLLAEAADLAIATFLQRDFEPRLVAFVA
jgi:hypothetical protein